MTERADIPNIQPEVPVDALSFPEGFSAGPLDSIPGFKKAWDIAQKSSNRGGSQPQNISSIDRLVKPQE